SLERHLIRRTTRMPRATPGCPTPFELRILKVLWRRFPQAASEVRSALSRPRRRLAHTTIITMLNTLVRKKFLTRVRSGRAFVFTPCVSEAEVSQRMMQDLVDRVFDGSTTAAAACLLDKAKASPDELKELRQSISQRIKNRA